MAALLSGREKGGIGAKVRVASPFAREKGRMRVDPSSCSIQTSEPLTFILSPFKGRGEKLRTPDNADDDGEYFYGVLPPPSQPGN